MSVEPAASGDSAHITVIRIGMTHLPYASDIANAANNTNTDVYQGSMLWI